MCVLCVCYVCAVSVLRVCYVLWRGNAVLESMYATSGDCCYSMPACSDLATAASLVARRSHGGRTWVARGSLVGRSLKMGLCAFREFDQVDPF